MAVSWTREQQQVIDLRRRDLLVSAAAGSGKTAVLVERILSLVTDPEHPVDIDRLLVVTFTRAAAGEMKERIGRALEERLAQDPDNPHLQRQSVLLDHAQISTIDGFCTFVLQNYFHRIDLDPGYRIAEEEELKVLRTHVLEDLLEEEYAAAEEGFLQFAAAYGNTRSDQPLADLMTRIYTSAVSDPDPEAWFAHCLTAYAAESEAQLEETDWMRYLLQEAGICLRDLARQSLQLAAFVETHPEGPQFYLPMLQEDARMLQAAEAASTYAAYREMLQGITFSALSRKKGEEEDPELRTLVQKQRNRIKEEVKKLQTEVFGMPLADVLRETAAIRPFAGELIRLVRRFRAAYTEAKREKNLLDFNDLEHLALQILAEKQEDSWAPLETARELAERFAEVMIDEYQDSNFLQEAILSAVSRAFRGERNRFMVGDVKQSIYGFRKARPELFLQQYHRAVPYREEEPAPVVRIDLHQNFRSRPEVLDAVNAVFSRIMLPALGGILYDDNAALHAGAGYPPAAHDSDTATELLIIDKKDPLFTEERGRDARTRAEAHVAAARIRALVRTGRLWEQKTQTYRPVTYRDCVILLRAAGTRGDIFARVLQEEGIPAYAVSGKGYFATTEVTAVLNYLRICDNPLQDIPLAAVLHSPMVGLTDAELACIRSGSAETSLYDALCRYRACAPAEAPTTAKVTRFLEQLDSFRAGTGRTPVHVLIAEILRETGYGAYAAVMPAGAQRQANLEMLVERAVAYEKTSYHGLFSFIRYVEQLEESSVDFGEVNLYGEEEDLVRIMTIHKSKGLEFPVVLLAGIGSGINRTDEKSRVVMHDAFGIGMAAVYPGERRIHSNTLLRTAVRNAIRRDTMAEELRVLYVAMTRAKEKLILIGTGEADAPSSPEDALLTYQEILSAGSYLDWIRMACGSGNQPIRESVLQGESLAWDTVSEDMRLEEGLRRIRRICAEGQPGSFAPEMHALLEAGDAFRYPEAEAVDLPAKITVSELKRRAAPLTEETQTEAQMFPQEAVVPYIPRFIQEMTPGEGGSAAVGSVGQTEAEGTRPAAGNVLAGAARGTAYHHVFAVLDYACFKAPEDCTPEGMQKELARMEEAGLLTPAEAASVCVEDFCRFLRSPLGRRMAAAAGRGVLHREQPFVLDIPVSGGSGKGPSVLLQGTIDAYWEEDGAYILADYKTDRVSEGDVRSLVEKYRKQLSCYSRALTQITGIPVREEWIYSISEGAIQVVQNRHCGTDSVDFMQGGAV